MQKKKRILKIIVTFIIILFVIYSSCYAVIAQVTKETLTQGFQNIESIEGLGVSQVNVGDNTISLNYNNQQLEVQYDLSNEPTFSYSYDIQQGMTSTDYAIENQNAGVAILGYVAIASLNNVNVEDALLYYALTSLESMGGISIDSSSTSQMDNNIIEYLNSLYGEPQIYNDSQYGNTYEGTTELQDVTDTSCRVVCTIKVNPNGDFSKINEYVDEIKNSFQGGQNEENTVSGGETPSTTEQNISNQNNNNQNSNSQNNSNQKNNNNNISNNNKTAVTTLPKTGIGISMYVILGIAIVLIIIFGIRYMSLKDVK